MTSIGRGGAAHVRWCRALGGTSLAVIVSDVNYFRSPTGCAVVHLRGLSQSPLASRRNCVNKPCAIEPPRAPTFLRVFGRLEAAAQKEAFPGFSEWPPVIKAFQVFCRHAEPLELERSRGQPRGRRRWW